MKKNDLLLFNGNIISMDEFNHIYSWILVSDGKIVDLGDDNEYIKYIGDTSEVYNLYGKTVLPGFYDCHVHLTQTGINLLGLDLSEAKSIDDLLEIIQVRAQKLENGKLIRAIHFDEMNLKEKRMPTRRELDIVSPNNPVWINRIEFHTSIVNSLALHMINLPYNIDGIARDERNLPDGFLTGKASAFVRNKIFGDLADDLREEGVKRAVEKAIENGITTVNAMEGGYTFHDKDAKYLIGESQSLPIDVIMYYQSFDIKKILDVGLKRIGGDIFIDGSFGSRTAALSRNYADDINNNGKLYFQQSELDYFVEEALKNDLQISLHAIGDRAIEQVLNSYEKHLGNGYNKNLKHRIEHFELATDEQIERCAKLGLVASMQPAFEYFWGNKGGMYEKRLGKELADSSNRFRNIIDSGIMVAGGSDSDVTPMNPILGIYSAVNHPKKEFAVTVKEAIGMFTINGAIANHEQDIKGSLEVGKYGDLVVLDKDPFSIDPKDIINIKVSATIKEGNVIFSLELQ